MLLNHHWTLTHVTQPPPAPRLHVARAHHLEVRPRGARARQGSAGNQGQASPLGGWEPRGHGIHHQVGETDG